MPPPPKRRKSVFPRQTLNRHEPVTGRANGFFRFTNNENVQIEVGPNKIPFSAHKNFICDASSFFKAAFEGKGDFKEKGDKLVALPEEDPEIFDLFMDYVYSGTYAGLDAETLKKEGKEGEKLLNDFVSLYVLADKVGAQELKRQMVQKWLSFTNYGKYYILSTTQLVSLYKRTIAGSALRKISVAQHAWIAKHSEEDIDSGFEEYGEAVERCPELGADLVRELFSRLEGEKEDPFNGFEPEDFYEPGMKKT